MSINKFANFADNLLLDDDHPIIVSTPTSTRNNQSA